MNILMVMTSNSAICESLRTALPDENLLLFEQTLENAMRRLISVSVDAIIIDDTDSSACDAIKQLQNNGVSEPIIALSGRGDSETLASLTIAGAFATVTKPFDCDDLRKAVQKAIEPQIKSSDVSSTQVSGDDSRTMLDQHQLALRWMSRISNITDDPIRMAEVLLEAVIDIYGVARCAVLLEGDKYVGVAASYGISSAITKPLKLNYNEGIMRWFEENACICDRDGNRTTARAIKEMRLLGAKIASPVMCRGRVCGAVLIGEKASGKEYAPEELNMLTLMSRNISMHIENAKMHSDVVYQENQFDSIISNIYSGVIMVMPDKTIGMINRSAERILQQRATDVLGRSVQRLGSGFADVVLRTLSDKKPRLRQEIRDAAIDATLGLSVTSLGDNGVVVIFSKLPEEKVESDVAYSPFWEYLSSRLAQEIKNPMVAVNTFAQLLPKNYDQEEFRDSFSEVMQREISRINSVVETLFNFAQHTRLSIKQLSINDTVKDVLRIFEAELEARSIKLHTELDADVVAAELDPALFSQALKNVVQNSIDAMPEGGKLAVTTTKVGDDCKITVTDTGEGISEQEAPLVFMPFFSTREKGMGLGLTIANRIMRQHDGSLELIGNTKNGCAFVMSVPNSKVI